MCRIPLLDDKYYKVLKEKVHGAELVFQNSCLAKIIGKYKIIWINPNGFAFDDVLQVVPDAVTQNMYAAMTYLKACICGRDKVMSKC